MHLYNIMNMYGCNALFAVSSLHADCVCPTDSNRRHVSAAVDKPRRSDTRDSTKRNVYCTCIICLTARAELALALAFGFRAQREKEPTVNTTDWRENGAMLLIFCPVRTPKLDLQKSKTFITMPMRGRYYDITLLAYVLSKRLVFRLHSI